MKNIGIIGFGYWGGIIVKNLNEMGFKNITICEKKEINWDNIGSKYHVVRDFRELINCDCVFVIVPVENHYEICKYFLSNGINVFCEKPLCKTLEECEDLYKISEDNNCLLFVDWLFTFNSAVLKIKEFISINGKPKSIIANRMNYGPQRFDVNARLDLASHDISIAYTLLDEVPSSCKWIDFKRNINSTQDDSCVGILNFSQTNVQINTSWSYTKKNRLYVLEFDNGFMHWDDSINTITYNDEVIEFNKQSPLHNSIKSFINKNFIDQKAMTLNITKILTQDIL